MKTRDNGDNTRDRGVDQRPRTRRHGFDGFVATIRQRFGFLAAHGYGAARVHVLPPRECTVVYWGADGVNVVVFHDLGSPPCVQIVPLRHQRADGSTRSFGLHEAVAVLAPADQASRPGPIDAGWDRHMDTAWLDWYAQFLERHADALLHPSPSLLDRIEARR